MTGKILYKSSVSRDLKHIDSKNKERLLTSIRTVLAENPKAGEPLRGEFEGLFKIRVGDYRIIYALVGENVLILRIGRRSNVYG
ncbi:MAG: type II toxin-antitoxin system RelE/ParE family toxin [Thaumarchaeota archaeon]|nr:type II toxin-antitoxin system RelE/ParE family toxin [Nitrososphaerota archaeon]